MSASVLSVLQNSTSDLHAELESTPTAKLIVAAQVSYDDVIFFLSANYHCMAGLEQYLEDSIGRDRLFGYWGYVPQSPKIKQDFARLDISLPDSPLPGCPSTMAYALGGLYVLMGSRFGKSVIRKHLLPMHRELVTNLSFFTDTAMLPQQWRAFAEKLELNITSETDNAQCIAGARQFFAHFLKQWKNENGQLALANSVQVSPH